MKKLRYIAYVRKSTEQSERQSLSIPAQKRKIKEMFPDIYIARWIEESQSAFKPGRPGFNQMMQILEAGDADGIAGWHPDRISRNEVDAAQITYGMRQGLIKDLKFGSYTFENSPEGIMMLQNVMSHSQYFSSKLSKDVKRGNEEQRQRGWLTGRAMEGYLNARSPDGRDFGIVIKDPERYPMRRQMWDLMLTGAYSVPQICKIANEQWGYTTRSTPKRPGGKLTRNGVYAMFNNYRYAGKIPIPGMPGEFTDASYPAMVTDEEFNRVQALLGRKGCRKLTTKKDFTFRGTVMCGECGAMVTAEDTVKRYKNGTSRVYKYYHCTLKNNCTQRKFVREEKLEAQLNKLLEKYTILPQFKDWALETLKEQNKTESTDIESILSTQDKTIETSHKEMNGLIDMAARELISEEQFLQKKVKLEKHILELENEREKTKKQAENWYARAVTTFELAVHGRERFNNGDIETKKEVLANIGSNPVLLDGKLHINTYAWMVPISKEYKKLEAEYEKVRTLPQQIQKDAYASVCSKWQGWQELNPRPSVLETDALAN